MATTEIEIQPTSATTAPESVSEVPQLPRHKVKVKKPLQRSCNETNDKGKICAGHLKRWFYASDTVEQECGDVAQVYGTDAELYRCEHCKTIYLPNPEDPQGVNVSGVGKTSVFGITVAKEQK